jgi:hypothetical protein
MKKLIYLILVLSLFQGLSHAIDKKNFTVKPIKPGTGYFKPAALKVLTPNGGETWCIGGFSHVTWSETNVTQYVKVWIRIAGSDAIFEIGHNIPPGTLSADYSIPANFGYSGQVFKVVVATMDGQVMDESDNYFTIRKPFIEAQMNDGYEPQQYTGPCPVTLNFSAKIHVEFPCQVKYRFWYEDGSESQVFSTLVQSYKDVPFTRTISGTLEGHVCIRILSPTEATGVRCAYFNVHCAEAVK